MKFTIEDVGEVDCNYETYRKLCEKHGVEDSYEGKLYYSESKKDWITFDSMVPSYFKNVFLKFVRSKCDELQNTDCETVYNFFMAGGVNPKHEFMVYLTNLYKKVEEVRSKKELVTQLATPIDAAFPKPTNEGYLSKIVTESKDKSKQFGDLTKTYELINLLNNKGYRGVANIYHLSNREVTKLVRKHKISYNKSLKKWFLV